MRKALFIILVFSLLLSACQSTSPTAATDKKNIVVTYSILGALVKELVGDQANVTVLIPNGQDPHEWEPSAKDIETLMNADLIVQNGLGLEGGLEKTLSQAAKAGVKMFIASRYITVRKVGRGEGIPNASADQAVGSPDPHIWTDPLTMKQMVIGLSEFLNTALSIDVSAQAQDLENRLDSLNNEISKVISKLPEADRKLVTGHESLGYFAQRYGFQLIGAIIPSLNSQAEVSAADMAALKTLIEDNQVKAIFSELGTPPSITDAIARETGVKVVQLSTHILPADGSYFTFMRNLAQTIVDNLR
ncbi:MAG: zinc ABC transporter substrate-binding protein [Anaerolineae bacterium]|nr:zinc ABC transporter substrate-binding protein [Anaerolineae bacterium]